MGYTPDFRNSTEKFTINGTQYVLSLNLDDDAGSYILGIFKQLPTGAFVLVPPAIKDGITDDHIMSFGSIYNFLQHYIPIANQHIAAIRNIPKPNAADKCGGAMYDLAMGDVKFQGIDGLVITREPPLSHAR